MPAWDGDIPAARRLQDELARQLLLRDDFARPLRTIAGFDVGFEDDGAITRAAAILLDADSLDILDQQVARLPTRMPYIPGLLSFRELPALLEALAMLKHAPDHVVLSTERHTHRIDGCGIRRFLIATAHGFRGGKCGSLRDPHRFEREISVHRKILDGDGRADGAWICCHVYSKSKGISASRISQTPPAKPSNSAKRE